jgi:hypothetical protein
MGTGIAITVFRHIYHDSDINMAYKVGISYIAALFWPVFLIGLFLARGLEGFGNYFIVPNDNEKLLWTEKS